MTEKWLSIIGIGEDGLKGLTPSARALVDNAEILIGGARHLDMVPEDGRERRAWPSPIRTLIPEIEGLRGQRVCVLATGDPMHFGVGTTLLRGIPADEVTIIPGRSAFTMATARLGWTRHEVECLTLHGRPLDLLQAYLQPGARLLVLTDDGSSTSKIADLLSDRGYGGSKMTILERMDAADESYVFGTAENWETPRTNDFNTVAIECISGPNTPLLSRIPGLPDDAFASDGQLTKREVRAVTLSALAPTPGDLLWDIGAGCGSIAIEWMRQHPRNAAIAVEREPSRIQMIATNAAALGTPLLKTIAGDAAENLDELPQPDAVFVGGGISTPRLLERCWEALAPSGRLVANVVTTEGERALFDWREKRGGELRRLSIERAEQVGRFTGWRPAMTVTQYYGCKS